jgi:AcrR family transcriptional regulator
MNIVHDVILHEIERRSSPNWKKVHRRTGLVNQPSKPKETPAARKERLRGALIEAAERAIAREGLAGLKARELAAEIDVALGQIYNLVDDLDELFLRVASRTLNRLDSALAEAQARAAIQGPLAQLAAVGQAYRAFASANLHLWRTLFEHRMAPGKEVPDWALADQMSLFRHILAPLEALAPHASADERRLLAHTLFSAAHGIVILGLDEKHVGVPPALIDAQIEMLVRLTAAGLAAQPLTRPQP